MSEYIIYDHITSRFVGCLWLDLIQVRRLRQLGYYLRKDINGMVS